MTKERLRIIIGENIRNYRTNRNISTDELAEMLELTAGFVGLIERGQRGTTPSTLFKLADIFGVSIDSFFYRTEDNSTKNSENTKEQVRREKITSFISDFSDVELDFVISVVKSLRALNRSKSDGDLEDFTEKLLDDED